MLKENACCESELFIIVSPTYFKKIIKFLLSYYNEELSASINNKRYLYSPNEKLKNLKKRIINLINSKVLEWQELKLSVEKIKSYAKILLDGILLELKKHNINVPKFYLVEKNT